MPPRERLRAWLPRRVPVPLVGLAVTLLVLIAAMTIAFPEFATFANGQVIATGFMPEALMSLGMTAVIVSGGIDLSVGAVLPFTAILAGLMLHAGVSVPLAIGTALICSAVVGLLNAALSSALRVHPFIVTLATMLVLKGVNLVVTGGAPVSGFPTGFTMLGQGTLGGVPAPLIVFTVLATVFGVALRHHRFWQQVYLIGGNPRAAQLAGVPVDRILLVVYAVCALMAGVAGVLVAAAYGSVSAGFGQNSELKVITAVVLGGANLNGGTGSIGGTLLGVLLLAVLYDAFTMTGVSTYWQDVVSGAMVLGSVLAAELLNRRRLLTAS
jgi:ribose transport system permease protein